MEINDLNNIQINKKYKNYKELCKALKEKIKTGKSKQLQLKDWERYFNYTKEGNGFIITEIYNTPIIKIDNRGKSESSRGNNNVYGKYIDIALVDYFKSCIENNTYTTYETINMLAERSKMINYNFRYCNANKYNFKQIINEEKNINITNTAVYNVFNAIEEIKRKPIIASLNRLKSKDLIEYEMNYIIYNDHFNRLPNAEENKIIEECVKVIKEELKIKSIKKIMGNEKIKNEYYTHVNSLVKKKIQNCNGIYQGFKIKININILDEKIENDDYNNKLNNLIIEKIKERMSKNKKNIEKKFNPVGQINPFWKKYIKETLDKNYLPYTEIVIDYLLSLNATNIINKILKLNNENKERNRKYKNQEQDNIKLAKELIECGICEAYENTK